MYFGDIRLGDTIDIKFTTRRFSTGAPFTLAGTPVISAYPGNDVVQLTAGITLTVDFDAVTGLNSVRVVATGANGYVTAQNYALVITTGTVDAVSVVGEVIGSFSIEARSALIPTVAARTLDVSATGEAGVDWANVGSPTTTVGLSGTTVGTLTTNSDKTGYSIGVGGIGATAFAAGAIDAAAIAADAIGAAEIAAGAIDAATFAAGAIDSAAIATNAIDADALNANVIDDIWAGTALTESYAADGATATPAQLLYMIWSALAEFAISGTTITAKKLDGTTTAATFTLDSATDPTSRTRAT